jgi:hypothetical protein
LGRLVVSNIKGDAVGVSKTECRYVVIFARVKAAGDQRCFAADLISREMGGGIGASKLVP